MEHKTELSFVMVKVQGIQYFSTLRLISSNYSTGFVMIEYLDPGVKTASQNSGYFLTLNAEP